MVRFCRVKPPSGGRARAFLAISGPGPHIMVYLRIEHRGPRPAPPPSAASRPRTGVGVASSTLETYESENAFISNLPSVRGSVTQSQVPGKKPSSACPQAHAHDLFAEHPWPRCELPATYHQKAGPRTALPFPPWRAASGLRIKPSPYHEDVLIDALAEALVEVWERLHLPLHAHTLAISEWESTPR